MQFARLNGVVIHYRWSKAAGEKPVLVFSNALGTDLRIWDEVAEHLRNEASILAYDKRGHGLSDLASPPYAMADHVKDLAGLLDHLSIRQAVICGLSVGGLIAQGLISLRPDLVRALILSDTAPKIGTNEMWNARIRAIETDGLASILDGIMARWFRPSFRKPENPAYAIACNMFLRQDPKGYNGTCAAIRDADFTEVAGRITVPTLCIAGNEDGSTPPDLVKAMAEKIKGSRFQVIAECGHLPCLEQPAKLSELIKTFIADLGKGAAHG